MHPKGESLAEEENRDSERASPCSRRRLVEDITDVSKLCCLFSIDAFFRDLEMLKKKG